LLAHSCFGLRKSVNDQYSYTLKDWDMPPLVKMQNPIRLKKLTNLMQIRGVDTYVRWSVFAVAALILAGVARHPGLSLLGLIAYLSVL